MQVSNAGAYQPDPSLFVPLKNGDVSGINNTKGQNGGVPDQITFTDVAGKDFIYRQPPINKPDAPVTDKGLSCQQEYAEKIEEAAKKGEATGSKWGGLGGATVGGMTGGALGMLVGSALVPGPGTAAGTAIGSAIGGTLFALGWGGLLGVAGSLLGGSYGRREAKNEAQEYTPACSKQPLEPNPLKPEDQPKSQDQPHPTGPTGPYYSILEQKKESEVAQAA